VTGTGTDCYKITTRKTFTWFFGANTKPVAYTTLLFVYVRRANSNYV